MKWTYLLLFNDKVGTREEVKSFLNSKPADIDNWYTCFSNAFFVVSERASSGLRIAMREFTENKPGARFFIVDVDSDRDGWMPQGAWDFLREHCPRDK